MEQTIFTKALGNSPVIKVIDFLLEGRGLDYSLTDIAENSNIGWTTLHRIWDNLVKYKLVVFTRKIGKAKLYTLNMDNPAVIELMSLYDIMLKQETDDYFARKNPQAPSARCRRASQAAFQSVPR